MIICELMVISPLSHYSEVNLKNACFVLFDCLSTNMQEMKQVAPVVHEIL